MLLRHSIATGIVSAASFSAKPASPLVLPCSARCVLAPVLARSLGGGHLPLRASVVPSASFSTMADSTEADVASQQPESVAKSSNDDQNKQLGKLSAPIMPHILNLYGLQATAEDYEIYAPDATFEDPLMKAKGIKQIKSAFYSMPKVFGEGKIAEYDVKETETSPGSGEILIDNTQHYKVWGKDIDMKSLIKLQVENGKVIRHEDLWDKHPLWTKDTVKVPLVGRAVQGWRRVNMLVTHAFMGFGKDPKPRN